MVPKEHENEPIGAIKEVEYFNSLVSMITDDARCKSDNKPRCSSAKVVFINKLDLIYGIN